MNQASLTLLTACLLAVSARGQGTLNFNTRFAAAGVDMPVFLGSVDGARPGPEYSAALYLADSSGLALIPSSITTFRPPFNGDSSVASYIAPLEVVFPPGLGSVTVRMRAWLTAAGSYESAPDAARGESADMFVPALGMRPGPPTDFPSNAQGFVVGQGHEFVSSVGGVGGYPKGFVFVPEPSTLALAALGAIGVCSFRRRPARA